MRTEDNNTAWNRWLIVRDATIILGILIVLVVGLFYLLNPHPAGAPGRISKVQEHSRPKPPPPKPFEYPAGGRTIFPAYRLVALYGVPANPVLGVLGEQPLGDAIARAKAMAGQYQPYSKEKIYPTLEIIATVASAGPTDNNDYSQETEAKTLAPWVEAAQNAGVYVVLDLQPGRSDFLRQAKEYQSLLEKPNVGLALDPEWRLSPDQVPLKQIGSVSIDEVNQTAAWLSALTASGKLPQKLFLLHQFRLSMLPNRDKLNTAYANLAYAIQMDGQGTQAEKQATWKAIMQTPPPNVQFGWKNFVDEDHPMLTPAQTMQIAPTPWYISYQ